MAASIGYNCKLTLKFRNISYLLSLTPGIVAIAGNLLGNWWSAANIVYSLVFLATFELLLGDNTGNENSNARDKFPEYVLFLHVVVHSVLLGSLFYGINSGILNGFYIALSSISSGIAAGSGGIVVGHELIHKASSLKQVLGKYLLLTSGNFYFFVHHLRIHHRYVGTEQDAATAKYNETLYQFYVRTIQSQIIEAWQEEKRRLMKLGLSAFSLKNEIALNLILLCMAFGILLLFGGFIVAAAFALFFTIANLLLEYVNYIEHYGLNRQLNERVSEIHSWNSDKVVSRFLLVDLSRHADHHNYPSKAYHTLQSYPNSPTLPGGYASLIIPALIPPLWKRMVHPILDSMDKNKNSH